MPARARGHRAPVTALVAQGLARGIGSFCSQPSWFLADAGIVRPHLGKQPRGLQRRSTEDVVSALDLGQVVRVPAIYRWIGMRRRQRRTWPKIEIRVGDRREG